MTGVAALARVLEMPVAVVEQPAAVHTSGDGRWQNVDSTGRNRGGF